MPDIASFLRFHAEFVRQSGSSNVTYDVTAQLWDALGQPDIAPPPPTVPPPVIAWTDSIQSSSSAPFGFSQIQLEYPIGTSQATGNSNVDLARVANPLGSGFALKHLANLTQTNGARSQAGLYSFANSTFNNLVKSPGGIYVAQEWYFPAALSAGSSASATPWINLWDWHSTSSSDRWDTQPGMMLAPDGSMRIMLSWHHSNDPESAWSTIPLPVGRWFDIEMHYAWATDGADVQVWIDGQLALREASATTKDASHTNVEMYNKLYGSKNTGNAWSPNPVLKYVRNVRLAGERIWR